MIKLLNKNRLAGATMECHAFQKKKKKNELPQAVDNALNLKGQPATWWQVKCSGFLEFYRVQFSVLNSEHNQG